MKSRPWAAVIGVLGAVALTCAFAHGMHLLGARPRDPDPSLGFVTAFTNRGSTVYVTEFEAKAQSVLESTALWGISIGVLLTLSGKWWRTRAP